MQNIIYLTEGGTVAIVMPIDCGLTVEEIAAKDVPAGRPFAIISASDVPEDREDREIWRSRAALSLIKSQES